MAKKPTKEDLRNRITELEAALERQVVRSNLYLELIARTRDLGAKFAPVMVMSQEWEPINRLMTDTEVFEAEVDARLEKARKTGWSYLAGLR